MDRGFWATLKKPVSPGASRGGPVFALAPMANVTDAAFRRIIAKYGAPDIFWTEFVSVEGLLSRGREKLLVDFWYGESERPIVAQIFGGKPAQFYEVAKLIVKLGFDGIDINMGCPDKGVEKSGGGAAMIKNPKLAQEIILETKRGVADAGSNIPVSVKTRLGYNKDELETWLPALLEAKPAAITLHARTRKEMSFVAAHWEWASQAVVLRDKYSPETLLLGNGDLKDLSEARTKVMETGLDGMMLGRAIFGNPWLFSEKIPTVEEKLHVCVEHTKLFEELYGDPIPTLEKGEGLKGGGFKDSKSLPAAAVPSLLKRENKRIKPFDTMKKHFKAYVNGFDGAKELRIKMMESETVEEIEKLVNGFLNKSIS